MARLVGPWTETPRAQVSPPKEHDRKGKAGTGGSWGLC